MIFRNSLKTAQAFERVQILKSFFNCSSFDTRLFIIIQIIVRTSFILETMLQTCKGRENALKSRTFVFACDWLVAWYLSELQLRKAFRRIFPNFRAVPFFLGIYSFSRQNKREQKSAELWDHRLLHWQFDCAVRFSSNITELLSYNRTRDAVHFGIIWWQIMNYYVKKRFNVDSILIKYRTVHIPSSKLLVNLVTIQI